MNRKTIMMMSMAAGLMAVGENVDDMIEDAMKSSGVRTSPRTRDLIPQSEQDEKIRLADLKRKRKFAKKNGLDINYICKEIGCFGVIVDNDYDTQCVCHLGNPPCGHCTREPEFECTECGAEAEIEEI